MKKWESVHTMLKSEHAARSILQAIEDLGITLRIGDEGMLHLSPREAITQDLREMLGDLVIRSEVIRLFKRGPWLSDHVPANARGKFFHGQGTIVSSEVDTTPRTVLMCPYCNQRIKASQERHWNTSEWLLQAHHSQTKMTCTGSLRRVKITAAA